MPGAAAPEHLANVNSAHSINAPQRFRTHKKQDITLNTMLQDKIDEFEFLKSRLEEYIRHNMIMIPLCGKDDALQGSGAYYIGRNTLLLVSAGHLMRMDATSDHILDAFRKYERKDMPPEQAIEQTNARLRQWYARMVP